jgi:hypothetical protein
MLIINPLTQTVVAQFELWRSVIPATSGLCLTRAGSKGDQARSMLSSDYELIQIIEGGSELEIMTKYYAYMDWGEYRSEWPDLAVIPYFYRDAIEVLKALPKQIKPLSEIIIYADGHTEPPIPSPIPLITIQDRAVWSVEIKILYDFGGHGELPINERELIAAADELIRSSRPDLLDRVNNTSLICPIDLADRMRWVAESKSG